MFEHEIDPEIADFFKTPILLENIKELLDEDCGYVFALMDKAEKENVKFTSDFITDEIKNAINKHIEKKIK